MWAILGSPNNSNSNWCCKYLDCETVNGLFQWLYVDCFTVSPAVQIENPQQHIGIMSVIMFQFEKVVNMYFRVGTALKVCMVFGFGHFLESFYCITRKIALQVYQRNFHVYVNHGPWGPYFQAVFYPEKGHN